MDQIAICYISMDASQRALQTNGKFFPNFNFVFKLLAENREKKSNCVNIDRSAIYYISMDMTRQLLQTNGKLFFKFRNNFS